jgi:hypothetical protein
MTSKCYLKSSISEQGRLKKMVLNSNNKS